MLMALFVYVRINSMVLVDPMPVEDQKNSIAGPLRVTHHRDDIRFCASPTTTHVACFRGDIPPRPSAVVGGEEGACNVRTEFTCYEYSGVVVCSTKSLD